MSEADEMIRLRNSNSKEDDEALRQNFKEKRRHHIVDSKRTGFLSFLPKKVRCLFLILMII